MNKGTSYMTITLNLGLLLLRLVIGLTLAVHGAQKLFGWFAGPGLTRLMQGFEKQRFKPVWFWVCLVIVGELGGGISFALGFLTPLGAAGIFGAMFMATFKSHWKNGFIVSKGGYEYTLVLMAVSTAIGLIGPGSYSLDSLFGIALPEVLLFSVLSVSALIVDIIGLLISREVPVAPPGGMSSAS
jgi:putative oxidoreductase